MEAQHFEDQARSSKRDALLVAGLQLVSRFLGFCALTWATVVLLGGFASDLRLLDFYLISILLLLEGARLFIVQIFSKLLSRAFFRELRPPEHFTFTDRQPSKALRLDLIGQALSFILAAVSLGFTIVRLYLSARGHALSEKVPPDGGHSNLPTSLSIFYILVICNSTFAIASCLLRPVLRQRCHGNSIILQAAAWVICRSGSAQKPIKQDSLMCFQKPIKQDSLMCFHDEVYKTAMETGLPEADQLDVLDFAFTKLASDYKRNIRPPQIKELNKDLISHLYHGQHGIAMACEYLKGGGDVWKQLVAANLPGFWAGEGRIASQVALFWALRGRIYGAGRDAESALNSIECLGRVWADEQSRSRSRVPMELQNPYPFLVKDPAANSNVVDTLVDLLLEPIRPTLLFQVRAFEACCRHPQVLRHLYKSEDGEEGGGVSAQLQALIVANECAQRGLQGRRPLVVEGAGLNRLRKLCCTLQSIVAGGAGRTWTTTNIYAGGALVALLCYGEAELLGQGIKDCFADTVERYIDPAAAAQVNRDGAYFWVSDLEVVERLRLRLGLQRYPRWHEVRLIQLDGTAISHPEVIDRLVNQARRD